VKLIPQPYAWGEDNTIRSIIAAPELAGMWGRVQVLEVADLAGNYYISPLLMKASRGLTDCLPHVHEELDYSMSTTCTGPYHVRLVDQCSTQIANP
jgi:hypothetical protein